MHYVSWDRTDRDAPKLLAEAGPEVLAEFTHEKALLHGADGGAPTTWHLTSNPEAGASASVNGEEIVSAPASLKRDKQIPVTVAGTLYMLIAEGSKYWIVEDAAANKVAQFTTDHNGVRRAVLEFDTTSELGHPTAPGSLDAQTDLPYEHIVGLAWVSRLVLESRKMVSMNGLIAFMLAMTAFIVLVAFLTF